MTDKFANRAHNSSGPSADGLAIIPHDNDDLPQITRGLYVGSGGDVSVQMQSGVELTFANVAAGTLLPIRARRVLSTGTNAQDIVGLL